MKKKIIMLVMVFCASFMILASNIKADEGDPILTINNQDTYTSFTDALAAAESGDSIELIQNVDLEEDVTIPAGITFKVNTNVLTVSNGFTLTILGNLFIGPEGEISNEGNITLENSAVNTINGLFTNIGQFYIRSGAVVNINGIADFRNNSKILSDGTDGAIVNINRTGVVTGNASVFDTAGHILFNNYGGRLSAAIVSVLPEGYYNYFPLYNEDDAVYYTSFDEIVAGKTVEVIGSMVVNGETTLVEGAILTVQAGKSIQINGTFTVNGTMYITNGYSPLIVNNLLGTGTIYLNRATEMATSYWTYVNIINDVATTLKFEAQSGYNPSIGDVLFEIGDNNANAVKIAAKINLGDSFNDFVVNPQTTTLENQYGFALGVVAEQIIDEVIEGENPKTGNENVIGLTIFTSTSILIAMYLARKIYILNKI